MRGVRGDQCAKGHVHPSISCTDSVVTMVTEAAVYLTVLLTFSSWLHWLAEQMSCISTRKERVNKDKKREG